MADNDQKRPCRRSSRIKAKAQISVNHTPHSKEIHLTYDVLRIIFHHLSYKDLTNVSLVSRTWSEAAYLEMKKRNEPVGFMEHCKILKEGLKPFLEKVLDIRIRPYVSFFFVCSKTLYLHLKQPLVANTFRETQKNSEIIILHSAGVISEDSEIESKSKHVVCSFLPKIPNVDIKMYYMEKPIVEEGMSELIRDLQELPPPDEERSTCLILFCSNSDNYNLISFIRELNRYSNKVSSMWGGLVNNCYVYEKVSPALTSLHHLGILITGRMKTWSTVLNKKCNSKKKVEEHLQLWKQNLQLRKHSIGYMFACHARGKYWYRRQHVESSVFKSLFPDVHLVGCFGYGEFGKHTLLDLRIIQKCQVQEIENFWYTQYSTIFMILTYD